MAERYTFTPDQIRENVEELRRIYKRAKKDGCSTIMEDCIAAQPRMTSQLPYDVLAELHRERMVEYRKVLAEDYQRWEDAIAASPDGHAPFPPGKAIFPGAPQ